MIRFLIVLMLFVVCCPVLGQTIILDEDKPTITGFWNKTDTPDAYHGSYLTTVSGAENTSSCTWSTLLPMDGLYQLSIFIGSGANRSERAPYTVTYSNGETLTFLVNQIYSPSDWFPIGDPLPYLSTSSAQVQLTNGTGEDSKSIIADAIRYDYITPVPEPSGLIAIFSGIGGIFLTTRKLKR